MPIRIYFGFARIVLTDFAHLSGVQNMEQILKYEITYCLIRHAWLGGWEGWVEMGCETIQQAGTGKGPGCQGFYPVSCFSDRSD